MSFDYDKIQGKEGDHGSWWTSYADLFMMLSIVFLLMYVASSLRNGSAGFQQQTEFKQLQRKAADLEEQIKAYTALKEQELTDHSTEEEQQVYQKLMDKLSLLQEEAKTEKEDLLKKAKENQDKEFALNQYQKIVRNIIDANVLAKAQIHRRDTAIVVKDQTIQEKKKLIAQMERTVAKNENEIQSISAKLQSKIKEMTHQQKRAQLSKKELNRRISELKSKTDEQILALRSENEEVAARLGNVKSTLHDTQAKLGQANVVIEQQETEKQKLSADLQATRQRFLDEMAGLKAAHAKRMTDERAAFEKNLNAQRLSAEARAKKIEQFAAQARQKAGELEGQLAGLQSKVKATEAELSGAQQEKSRYLAAVEGLKKENAQIQGDLERTREIANAKKKLAEQIAANFRKAGIKAGIDGKSGEVTLDFGEEYFDAGSSELKPLMRQTLDKFIPIYAQSLFNDPKIADKIANVEIVGFASSTYNGKYVNPKSVRPEDKEAIDYNLRLSFNRANSIFKHILNRSKLSKEDQQKLFPLMKIVGRGYLPEGRDPASIPDGISEKEFCKNYNCQKAQRVIVKFNMKD